jgi:hypothetical protein
MLTNIGTPVPSDGGDDQQNVAQTSPATTRAAAPEPAREPASSTPAGPATALTVPVIDTDADALTIALALAEAGFYVLPTAADNPRHAGSVLKRGWPDRSSRDPEQLVAWFAGTDHRVAIHCGRSGVVAFDIDHWDALTELVHRAVTTEGAPFHGTRQDESDPEFDPMRGHYLFRVPPGRRLTNSNGALGKGWGEVRGNNGIILVGGPGRAWLQTGEVPVLPDYIAEQLPDGGDRESTVSDDDVARFVRDHPVETSPGRLVEILTGFSHAVAQGGSRHQALVGAACWATREIVKGRLAAKSTYRRLADEFVAVMGGERRPGDRKLARRQAMVEARTVIAWAVAQEGQHVYSATTDRLSALGNVSASPAEATPGATPPAGLAGVQDTGAAIAAVAEQLREQLDLDPEAAVRAAAEQVELDAVKRRERILIRAREQLRAEMMPRPVRMSGREFLTQPEPTALIPSLLYRDSLAHIFGPPGGGKSFVVLDWALRLANGMTWGTGDQTARLDVTTVHYVMAEGVGVNVARTNAWLAHHGRGPDALDRFHPWPTPILLTEAGLTHYLREVERDRPGLIILDTKNAMMDGDENSGSDSAVLVRAMHQLRIAAGGACVALVDHSGNRDPERSRGSNAVKAASDTQIRIMRDDDTGTVEVKVTRDKAAEPGTTWLLDIRGVSGTKGAVVVPALGRDGSPFRAIEPWWTFDAVELPESVAKLTGRGADTARDCYRVMCWVDDLDGLTAEQVYKAVRERPGDTPGDPTLRAGFAMLKREGIAVQGSTPTRFVISQHFAPTRKPSP